MDPNVGFQDGSSDLGRTVAPIELRGRRARGALRNFGLQQIENMRRQGSQIERTVADFETAVAALEKAIVEEEDRTHIHDPTHFAYSACAKAMAARRGNLCVSIADLQNRLTATRSFLAEMTARAECPSYDGCE